jgi:hypothetical protein
MADTIVSTQGTATVSVAASDKIACYSTQQYQVYQEVGFPNFPEQQDLLFEGSGAFTSSAFSAAATVIVKAGSAPVSYNVGTAAASLSYDGNTRQEVVATALNATGAVTAAAILGGIVTSSTAAAVAGTVPTGAVLAAAVDLSVGEGIEWSVINTGAANDFTVTAATDHTIVGVAAVQELTSARFLTVQTAAAVFVTYRLS